MNPQQHKLYNGLAFKSPRQVMQVHQVLANLPKSARVILSVYPQIYSAHVR